MGRTSAQIVAGVSSGNDFKYTVTVFWNSTNPNATCPSYLIEENKTEWYQATIQSVTDSVVEIQTTWRFQNGTEIKGNEVIDVATGNGGSMLVYAPNLNASDYLYPSGNSQWKVNETVNRTYMTDTRETNHITETRTDLGSDYVYGYVSIFFDKKTGILVEAYLKYVYSQTPDQTFSRLVTIQESNVWAIPEFPSFLILPLFMIATLVAVIVYRKKHTNVKVKNSSLKLEQS
jgi:hypothetical protein